MLCYCHCNYPQFSLYLESSSSQLLLNIKLIFRLEGLENNKKLKVRTSHMEFVTSCIIDTCVKYFLARVKFSRTNVKSYPFCEICDISNKITDFVFDLKFAKRLIICPKQMRKHLTFSNFCQKFRESRVFSSKFDFFGILLV